MRSIALFMMISLTACTSQAPKEPSQIERYDASLDQIISADATVEVIATGYDWSEGPLWLEELDMLLFSDVPQNTIYQWTEADSASVYLSPSGYTDTLPRAGEREPGSNGLLLNKEGQLVLCQHGDRRVALMQAPLNAPKPDFVTIAATYQGKRFNSPNDAVFDKQGNLYFTDPPYGLPQQMDDPAKELPFQGVYKVAPNGAVTLLVDSLTRPNGIALSPDEKSLFVANSDPERARWYRFELGDSTVVSGKIFYDVTDLTANEKGLPDGMKIDANGNVFATGPGGVFIFNSEGKMLGKIKFEAATSNCALADNDKTLYVTNDMNIIRITLRK